MADYGQLTSYCNNMLGVGEDPDSSWGPMSTTNVSMIGQEQRQAFYDNNNSQMVFPFHHSTAINAFS